MFTNLIKKEKVRNLQNKKRRRNLVDTASFSTLIAFGKGTNSSSVYTKPLNFTNFIELMNF